MAQFKPVKTNRIFEDVLVQLKEAILSGRFTPGEKLPSERELSLEFQVSRGVIREAIRPGTARFCRYPSGARRRRICHGSDIQSGRERISGSLQNEQIVHERHRPGAPSC